MGSNACALQICFSCSFQGPRGKSVIVTERLNNFSLVNNLPSYGQLRGITGLPGKALYKVVDTGDTYLVWRLFFTQFKPPYVY